MAEATTHHHFSVNRHEPSHNTADPPEPLHVSADHPEPLHVSAEHPEPLHVTADHPESLHITADQPESCHVLSATPIFSRLVLQYSSLVSSVRDAPLVSARAAGIPKSAHFNPRVPALIPLSEALPMMGIALCCVWAAYATSRLPQAMAPAAASSKVVALTAEPPEAAVLASAPFMVVAPSKVLLACHVAVKETVTTVEPSEVSVASTHQLSACPVAAKMAALESSSCPGVATEAAHEMLSCPESAEKAAFELPVYPISTHQTPFVRRLWWALVGSCLVCSALVGSSSICSALVGSSPACCALVGSDPICSDPVGSSPICSTLVGSGPVCFAQVGSGSVCSALVLCSAGFASVPGLGTSSWTCPSVFPPVPPPFSTEPGLFCVWIVWKSLLGGGGGGLFMGYISHNPLHWSPNCHNHTLHWSHSCPQSHAHLRAITHTLQKT